MWCLDPSRHWVKVVPKSNTKLCSGQVVWPIRPWASWFMSLPHGGGTSRLNPRPKPKLMSVQLGSSSIKLRPINMQNKKNYNRQNINKSTANVIIIEIIPNKYFISRNFLKRYSLLTEKKKNKINFQINIKIAKNLGSDLSFYPF